MALRVVVHGALGKMGQQVLSALCADGEVEPVGGVDLGTGIDFIDLPYGSGTIPYANSVTDLLARVEADVLIDFSIATASVEAARMAAEKGVHVVIGTSGIGESELGALRELSRRNEVGVLVVPNFALGAVVLTHLARIAARFFEYADIHETHHEAKIDAPSGTALALARAIAENKSFKHPDPEKEPLPGTRGGNYSGVSIHSSRMPGRLAHHEVVFGALGQTLSLRHDSISRESFMPAVLLAVKEVAKRRGFEVGLEGILGLS